MNNDRRPPMGQRDSRDARGPRQPGMREKFSGAPRGGSADGPYGRTSDGPRHSPRGDRPGRPSGPGGPRHAGGKFGGPRHSGGRPGGKPGGPRSGGPRAGGMRPGGQRRRSAEDFEVESDELLSGPVEANYLKELVAARTTIEVKLRDGASHTGTIEYWDQRFIRLTPTSGPNLFIFKHDIKYLLEK